MTDTLRARLTDAVRRQGGWSTLYLDLSGDRENPEGLAESRRRSALDRLRAAGADEATLRALDGALGEPTGLPSPFTRYLIAREGAVVVDEPIPGPAAGPETLDVGELPSVAPLIRAGVDEFAYLVVQVTRDGGDIAVHRTGAFFPELETTLTGRTDTLHKAASGGWSQQNHHEHVEELWKQTQGELSAEVDRLVQEVRPRLVVVAGDVRARGLLLDALGERSRALAVELKKDTRSDGADAAVLSAFVAEQVAAVEQRDRHDAVDLLRTRLGRERPAATRGLAAVVEALRQAQADTVFVDVGALADERLLALGDVPWLAAEPGDAGTAPVIGEVGALDAVVRAALLTDARILLAPAGELGAPAAALLRWPADQPAPV
ncbi:Vms1/Ankzf1 family peptidyl-tRNA hydrolase [Amnibacterium endophyticum]|uniref:Vms1/Ankzf1 family peptidyl-tRNA hydrolase n=1 Tax=Amnibacterium endophyticum TaxID=2109337 RepID=A0ABW4LH80_9MICO